VGTWIWVSGNTKPYKEYLKALGFRWNGKANRQCWQWGKKSKYKARYNPNATKDSLKSYYGSTGFDSEVRTAIN
jgi:hypothetical protein